MKFGEQLRKLRVSQGLSQKQLADLSGRPQQSIGRWEVGEQMPGFDAVQALCAALGVLTTEFDGCTFGPVSADKKRAGKKTGKVKQRKSKSA